MKQIILIEDRMEVYNLIESNLLNSFEDIEIISKLDSSDALKTLELLPNILLVVCRDRIDDDRTARNMIYFIKKNLLNTHVIVLGELPKTAASQKFVFLSKPQEYLDVITHASQMLEIPITWNKQLKSEYGPIPITYFSALETSFCDVYLCTKNTDEPDQYTKIIQAEKTFSQEYIESLQDKILYVPNQKRQNFVNILSDHWMKKIDELNHTNPSFEKKIESLTAVYEIIAWEIYYQGFVLAAVQLAESIVNSITKDPIQKNIPISTILQQIANAKSNYMYKHGHMVFVLSTRVLDEMGVSDPSSYRALCFASLFKDVSLINNPLLSKITTFEELESMDLDKTDYNAIINHACESAFALKNDIPKKSIELIIRHHGHPSGNGFSYTHFDKFDILNRTFFINCEFVKEFLTFETVQRSTNQRATPITYRLRRRYFFPEVSDAIEILNKTLQKQKKSSFKV